MMPPDQCADFAGIIDHDAIIAIARLVQTATSVGSPAPIVKRVGDWCHATPQPGDLVVEMSSSRMDGDRVGLFERFEERRVCSHEISDVTHPGCIDPDCAEWREESRRGERFVWILVQRDPERRCRWHNANFLRLPNNEAQWREASTYGIPKDELNRPGNWQPGGIDRAGLVGLLADRGFRLRQDKP
jgi:hypothetical protein